MERLPILSAAREEFVQAESRTEVKVRVGHLNNELQNPHPSKTEECGTRKR